MKILSTVSTVSVFLTMIYGAAARANGSDQPSYQCQYRINHMGQIFTMTGTISATDAEANEAGAAYLTLEPPTTMGIPVTARVLITKDNYNPMTLHPRGDTANTFALALLKGDEQVLSYADHDGKSNYLLSCKLLHM